MKMFATILLATTLPMMASCSEPATPPDATAAGGAPAAEAPMPAPRTAIGRTVARAMDEARTKLATEDIDLTDVNISRRNGGVSVSSEDRVAEGRPKATISPDGTLVIDGQPVPADARQRALLVRYRGELEAIASAGMDIGVQGADLGMHAATEALKGVFSGNTADIDARIEAESERIKLAARALCDGLPAMLRTQTALARAMPAFRPYATMDQGDVDDCHADDANGATRAATRDEMRSSIRDGIRTGIRRTTQAVAPTVNVDPAREADAAAETRSDAAPSVPAATERR